MLLQISGEIIPERMNGWRQSKNNTQSHEKDLSLVLSICDFFRIPYETAVKEVKKIYDTIQNNWRKLATKYGIPKREQDDMEICFNDPEREEYMHSLE